jgi:hypothetical protein
MAASWSIGFRQQLGRQNLLFGSSSSGEQQLKGFRDELLLLDPLRPGTVNVLVQPSLGMGIRSVPWCGAVGQLARLFDAPLKG